MVESALVVTNDRYHAALQRHLSAERLGALGDLHLALRRLVL